MYGKEDKRMDTFEELLNMYLRQGFTPAQAQWAARNDLDQRRADVTPDALGPESLPRRGKADVR